MRIILGRAKEKRVFFFYLTTTHKGLKGPTAELEDELRETSEFLRIEINRRKIFSIQYQRDGVEVYFYAIMKMPCLPFIIWLLNHIK